MLSSSSSLEVPGTGFTSVSFLARAARAISAKDRGGAAGSAVACWDAGDCAADLEAGGSFWAVSWAAVGLLDASPHKAAPANTTISFCMMLSPGNLVVVLG